MKRIIIPILISFLHLAFIPLISFAQQLNDHVYHPLSLSEFLSDVMKGNLGYIAEKFNVSQAEAEMEAARIFPDPEISVSYGNNEDRTLQMGQSVETGLSYPVSLGNKRRAGIELARSQYELSRLMLEAYFQNLRADAALSYYAAFRDHKIYLLQEEIYSQLSKLAGVDSIRLVAGEATELDALQSSLEARSQLTEVYQSLADMQNTSLNLRRLRGRISPDSLDFPSDDFPYMQRDLDLDGLINNAVQNRADLLVAIQNREVSEKNLRLLKANRAFEFSLETGYSYNSIVRNEIAPAPAYNGLSAGISIPLKFSNLNKGSLKAADIAIQQSQTVLKDTEQEIKTQVIRAFNDFIAQNRKVEHYNHGLVEDAYEILEGRIYSYQHGESNLLEVLNAQRTYTELKLNHLKALYEYTAALIELERSAGIWDLTK